MKIIEHQGKRYPVVGESETHYIVTEPWEEEQGKSWDIPKNEAKEI
jgi:hypothetical protein